MLGVGLVALLTAGSSASGVVVAVGSVGLVGGGATVGVVSLGNELGAPDVEENEEDGLEDEDEGGTGDDSTARAGVVDIAGDCGGVGTEEGIESRELETSPDGNHEGEEDDVDGGGQDEAVDDLAEALVHEEGGASDENAKGKRRNNDEETLTVVDLHR